MTKRSVDKLNAVTEDQDANGQSDSDDVPPNDNDTSSEDHTRRPRRERETLWMDLEPAGESARSIFNSPTQIRGSDNDHSTMGRRGRPKRSIYNEEGASANNNGGTEDWECCGNTYSAERRRCGICKKWRGGCRSPEKVKETTLYDTQDTAEDKYGWECCGEVYSSERKRCTFCKKWRGGGYKYGDIPKRSISPRKSGRLASPQRSARSPARKPQHGIDNLPPGIQINPNPDKLYCKVVGCVKKAQSGNDGCCRSHYNLIVLGKESTSKSNDKSNGVIDEGGSKKGNGVVEIESDVWACPSCGHENETGRCRMCYKWRDGKRGGGVRVKSEVIDLDNDKQIVKHKMKDSHRRCKIFGCNKFKQSNTNDMCYRHNRLSMAKCDNVEEAEWGSPSPDNRNATSKRLGKGTTLSKKTSSSGGNVSASTVLSVDNNVRRSSRTRALSPKNRHGDDDSASNDSIEVLPTKKRGRTYAMDDEKSKRGGNRTEDYEAEKNGTEVIATYDDNKRCIHEGCTKYRQTGRMGYCCKHFHIAKSIENGNNGSANRSSEVNEHIAEVTSSKLADQKKTKNSNSHTIVTLPPKKKIQGIDSLGSLGGQSWKSETKTDSPIKEGDMVKIKPDGLLARVININLAVESNTVTYDIVKILGGREEMVDIGRITPYRYGNIFKSQSAELKEETVQPLKNMNDLLEMTRYKLLAGQDCWICTSCLVVVPSLTIPCGVCSTHLSFVPLEIGEFEMFVRDQRKKRNRLWLQKKKVDRDIIESGFDPSTHLCKFQGCVQPSQLSLDGYCESHYNAAELVKEKDQPLTSDFIYLLYSQMKPVILTEEDWSNQYFKDRDIGEPGMACKHCDGKRCFPNGVEGLRQKSFRISISSHMKVCKECPEETKNRLAILEEVAEADKGGGKRSGGKPFLLRIWNRLQRLSLQESQMCRLQGCSETAKPNCNGLCRSHRTAARLVLPEDHSVIQDFASLTFEQMQPCYLVDSDRRDESNGKKENGSPGLECQHCIGQPGHLRYFPATETSLNEMGAVELISAHLRVCSSCPEKIKAKLASLAPGNESEEGLKTFYHRVWSRIQTNSKLESNIKVSV